MDLRATLAGLAAVGVALLAACAAPSRIESNKVQNYSADPKRLFVVSEMPAEWGPDFASRFHARLAEIVQGCGAALELSRLSSLELDDKARTERMRQFKPDGVLVIRRNGGTKDQYGGLIMVIFDSRFIDAKTDKVVWRSSTNFMRASLVTPAERGDTLAAELTNKLKADGIFASCPQVAPKKS